MKRQIGTLILILALVLGCCTFSPDTSEPVTGAVSAEPVESASTQVSEPEKTESGGGSDVSDGGSQAEPVSEVIPVQEILVSSRYNDRISLKESPELLFVDESTDLPERVPVYSDPYPSDHGEPEYEFTEEVKEKRRGNLTDFLDILYGSHEDREYETSDDGSHYLVSYQADRMEAWGREYGLHIYTKDYNVRGDAESGELFQNELIQAALDYTGIRQPQLRRVTQYKGGGKASGSVYIITEQSEAVLEGMQAGRFRYISVGIDTQDKKNRDTVRIVIEKNEPQETGTYETVAYQEALQYVQQKYAGKNVTEIRAEACYERKAAKGYFVPCYKFYVEYSENSDGKNGEADGSDVTYILMVKGWDAQTLQKAESPG